jgi:rRNA pseudouridine-1189 N-methylase Emg1 (Nep1/Mra1 family)
MKVIKNPITDHLPAGCRKVATSYSAENPIKPSELVPEDAPIAFIVGAMAHGQVLQFIYDYYFLLSIMINKIILIIL